MNSTGQSSLPLPEPECGAFVDLLPLLGAGTLEEREEDRLRLHLATCAYCRVQQSTYDRMDLALRRAFGAPVAFSLAPEDMVALPEEVERSASGSSKRLARFNPPPGHHTRRVVSLLTALVAVLLVVAVVTALVVSRAQPNTGTGHPVASTPTLGPVPTETTYVPNPNDSLGLIQMLSPTEGWAAGTADLSVTPTSDPNTTPHITGEPLMLHYHDGHWLRVVMPSSKQLGLSSAGIGSISMVSADEGWAVGYGFLHGTAGEFILHDSGGRWTMYGSLMRDTELDQVQMLSPTDGWMSGSGNVAVAGGHTSLMLHYDGTRWVPVRVPSVQDIGSLDMLSATDGWATGEGVILHYDGRQWSIFQQAPQIQGLSMGSASDGWAFGGSPSNPDGALLWHYNGQQWVQGPTITSSSLADSLGVFDLSMDSATDGWALGMDSAPQGQNATELYLHYSQGRWTKVQGPNVGVNTLTMLSADEGWAVGSGGVVMHYLNGVWSQYHF